MPDQDYGALSPALRPGNRAKLLQVAGAAAVGAYFGVPDDLSFASTLDAEVVS